MPKAQQLIGCRHTFLISTAMAVLMVVAVLFVKSGGHPVGARGGAAAKPDVSGASSRTAPAKGGPIGATAVIPRDPSAPAAAANDDSRNSRGEVPVPSARPRRRFSIRSIVEPRVVPLSLVFMLFAIPYFTTQSFLVSYAGARRLTVEVSLFFPCYTIALLIMRIAFRDWFDRKSFRCFFVICSACMLATLLCLNLINNNIVLIIGAILMAASYGIMSSVTQAQAVIIAGKQRSGIANSTYYAGIDLGMSLGPIIGGLLYGSVPIQWSYPLFMLAMPAAWLLYAAGAGYVHGTGRR